MGDGRWVMNGKWWAMAMWDGWVRTPHLGCEREVEASGAAAVERHVGLLHTLTLHTRLQTHRETERRTQTERERETERETHV